MTKDAQDRVIGFVVIGRNEGERLARCLASIAPVSNRVVYSDSGSTDGSLALAKSMGAHAVAADGSPMTAARGRNTGFEALRKQFPECDLVHFIDGDCVIEHDWVEKAARFLDEHPRAAVACGQRFEAHPDASFYNRIIDDEWNTPVGRALACGGDALMRVGAFEQAGGFRSGLIAGEEPDLCARLREAGWEIWRLDARMTKHDAAIQSLSQWMGRAARSGYGYAQVWGAARNSSDRPYRREMASAFAWVAAIPIGIILLALVFREPLLLFAIPAVYILQIARIAARKGIGSAYSWKYAALMMFAKLGEAKGILKYFLTSKGDLSFDYKTSKPTEPSAA
ncbi:MAG TPA: glycosyltransferase [Sphingomicrobium sp.]|nr:glycosyltransferase [Sphingomicrobium sp.]